MGPLSVQDQMSGQVSRFAIRQSLRASSTWAQVHRSGNAKISEHLNKQPTLATTIRQHIPSHYKYKLTLYVIEIEITNKLLMGYFQIMFNTIWK